MRKDLILEFLNDNYIASMLDNEKFEPDEVYRIAHDIRSKIRDRELTAKNLVEDFADFLYINVPELREYLDSQKELWHITGLTKNRVNPLPGRNTDRYIKLGSDNTMSNKTNVKVDGMSTGNDVKFRSHEDAEQFLMLFENRYSNRQKYDIDWTIKKVRKSKLERYPGFWVHEFDTPYGKVLN